MWNGCVKGPRRTILPGRRWQQLAPRREARPAPVVTCQPASGSSLGSPWPDAVGFEAAEPALVTPGSMSRLDRQVRAVGNGVYPLTTSERFGMTPAAVASRVVVRYSARSALDEEAGRLSSRPSRPGSTGAGGRLALVLLHSASRSSSGTTDPVLAVPLPIARNTVGGSISRLSGAVSIAARALPRILRVTSAAYACGSVGGAANEGLDGELLSGSELLRRTAEPIKVEF